MQRFHVPVRPNVVVRDRQLHARELFHHSLQVVEAEREELFVFQMLQLYFQSGHVTHEALIECQAANPASL